MGSETVTELINRDTTEIDMVGTFDVLTMINNEDIKVAKAVKDCIPEIAKAVEIITRNLLNGGRLLYVGAGTSGRLGVLDASECPPTFSVPAGMVKGIIAGGDRALREAIEGAEDSEDFAMRDFKDLDIADNDTLVGISASGNARYVTKFLEIAKMKKCKTIAITSNRSASMKQFSDCFICVHTGAEVISGSTRMKAGTAQKMVLNMISTASMIKIGKTYHNLMIDVSPTNEKLKKRAVKIVMHIADCKEIIARETLQENGYKVKQAILYIMYGLDFEDASKLLKEHQGVLRRVFESLNK